MTRLLIRPATRSAPKATQSAGTTSAWVSPARDSNEPAAERMAARVLAAPRKQPTESRPKMAPVNIAPVLATATPDVRQVIDSPGERLSATARADFEPRFGRDFSEVRVHRDAAAASSARVHAAQAYTVGSHVVFGAGRYAPESNAGRAILAHELSHVLQQREGGVAARIQRLPTQLADVPEAERRALRVGTIEVTIPTARISEFFRMMPSGRPSESRSVGATNSFSANIPATLQGGLASIAAYCAGDTNSLPLGSTIEVDLDLSAHGGNHATYRFSYFSHTEGSGGRATQSNVMLIEQLGTARAATAPSTAVSGAFTVNSTSFSASGSWNDADFTILREALALLPDAARTGAAGLTFRRTSSPVNSEAGRYVATTETIELNNLAFPATSNLRVGERSPAVRTVLHEIGHALDLRALEVAWRAFNAAGQSAGARRTFLAARSRSGSRYGAAGDGDYEQQQSAADAGPEFRQAVARDGVRRDTSGSRTSSDAGDVATLSGGITRYSETDYQELFAEAFSLYITEPETLRLLRPATFAYFRATYPRATP